MGIIYPPLTGEATVQAFMDEFITAVRTGLRDKIMERLEPDITAAVDAGVASLKTQIEAYAEHLHQRTVVNVWIDKMPLVVEPQKVATFPGTDLIDHRRAYSDRKD